MGRLERPLTLGCADASNSKGTETRSRQSLTGASRMKAPFRPEQRYRIFLLYLSYAVNIRPHRLGSGVGRKVRIA